MSGLSWFLGASPGPNVEQNLLISISKHLYLTKEGLVRRQQKPIEPRLPGKKVLLSRVIAYDVGTGAFYGEMHEAGHEDVLAFLARAWWRKPDHFMHGVPARLNIPRSSTQDSRQRRDIQPLQELTHFAVGSLPSGFKAGAAAVRGFDQAVNDITYDVANLITLGTLQAGSAIFSRAGSTPALMAMEEWESVTPAPASLFDAIDRQYDPPGVWRQGWDSVLQGFPKTRPA